MSALYVAVKLKKNTFELKVDKERNVIDAFAASGQLGED
jgi:hypothetical protein